MSDRKNKFRLARTATVAAFAALATVTIVASGAQAQSTMAPPVGGGGYTSGSPSGENVFQWQDVPQNRQVPITRAVFDQGGYQLFDDTGETIVVPFANQNLYVLRFGQTSGGMYFVNDGNTPTLYIPRGGYLENAAAQGAKWYPFPQSYAYSAPVYAGPAPSWSDWVGMGWYPGMTYYGGYYGYHPWHVGISYSPFPGLYFSIGGHPYYGWGAYHNYYSYHPYNRVYIRSYPSYHYTTIVRRGPTYFTSHPSHFGGYGSHYATFHGAPGRGFGGTTVINRNHTTIVNHPTFGHSGGSFGTAHNSSFGTSHSVGTTHTFGNNTGRGSFGGGTTHTFGTTHSTTTTSTTTHSFGTATGTSGGHVFRGGASNSGGSRPSSGSFGGSRPSGGSFGGGARPSGNAGGTRPSGGSFGGNRPSGGGSFGGGHSSGGGRSFGGGGGGRSFGGGSHGGGHGGGHR